MNYFNLYLKVLPKGTEVCSSVVLKTVGAAIQEQRLFDSRRSALDHEALGSTSECSGENLLASTSRFGSPEPWQGYPVQCSSFVKVFVKGF
jgi:hypothetical protein